MGEGMIDPGTVPKGLREMTLRELWAKAGEYRAQGVRFHGPVVEIHKKFAIPFATMIFGYLGVCLGVLFRRGEKLVSFAVSIAVAVVYYVFLLAGEPLGKQGTIPPFISMWAANIFFSLLTAFLLWKTVNEKPFSIVNRTLNRIPAQLSDMILKLGRRR